jgi:hypothetical protein
MPEDFCGAEGLTGDERAETIPSLALTRDRRLAGVALDRASPPRWGDRSWLAAPLTRMDCKLKRVFF